MHLRASLLLFTVSACLGYDEVSSPEYIAKTAAEKSDIVWANLMEDTTPGDWSDQTKTSPLFINQFQFPGLDFLSYPVSSQNPCVPLSGTGCSLAEKLIYSKL